MAERTLVVDHLKLKYEGLFNASEVYNIISSFFFEKGWDWWEKMNEETVTPKGRNVRMILEPWKSSSDYHKLVISIRLIMINLQDKEVEHEGKTIKLNQGTLKITFDGFVIADRNGRWKDTPFRWFLSIIAEQYFFKQHFEKMQTWIKSDIEDLQTKLKSYLNASKYMYQS